MENEKHIQNYMIFVFDLLRQNGDKLTQEGNHIIHKLYEHLWGVFVHTLVRHKLHQNIFCLLLENLYLCFMNVNELVKVSLLQVGWQHSNLSSINNRILDAIASPFHLNRGISVKIINNFPSVNPE